MTIFYVHQGNPFYLKYSLAQTKTLFPQARIILLGDKLNQESAVFAEHHLLKEYESSAQDFSKHYVHLSPNSVEFELFCF